MRVNDDGRTVAAMDALAPRIGEIIGGGERGERLAAWIRAWEHYALTLRSPASGFAHKTRKLDPIFVKPAILNKMEYYKDGLTCELAEECAE
jgi:hypothetical protein